MLFIQAGTKLVCAVLSLPVPSKSPYSSGDQVNNIFSQITPDYFEQRTLQKFLLIGYSGSGTSTIFKQVILDSAPAELIKKVVHLSLVSHVT